MNKIKMIQSTLAALSLLLLTSFSVYAIGNGKSEDTNPNRPSNDSLSSSLLPNVSYDRFGDIKKSGKSIYGDGSGDLILFMLDESGITPRKKSIMIDLHTTQDNQIIDLTANDLLSRNGRFDVESNDLSYFINQSKDSKNLKWLVVAVMNHITIIPNHTPGPPTVLEFVNDGLIISGIKKDPKKISSKDIKFGQSLFTTLIKKNNDYGIDPNNSLTSVTGEPTFLHLSRYGNLGNGSQTYGNLNDTLKLGFYKKEKLISYNPIRFNYSTSYRSVGIAQLIRQPGNAWIIQLTIK